MIKSILTASAIIFASASAAIAGPPGASVASASTIYGQFGCMERARNKFYAIGATSITSDNSSIWGYVGDSTVGVWCRGQEAIIITAGSNVTTLRDEVKKAF